MLKVMSEVIASLLVLQDREQRVNHLTTDLDHIPVEEAAITNKLAQQSTRFEQLKSETRKIETDRKKLELDVKSKKDAIAKYKSQQLQTRKNEEFTALNHEIEREEQEISKIEDEELVLMDRYDQGLKDTAKEEAAFKAYQEKAAQSRADLAKKKATLEKELALAKTQLTEAEGKVDELTLRRFHRIMASKKDVAVVPLMHGTCSGCHFKLTSTTINLAKSDTDLVACENCGRIIYWAT